MFKRMCPICDAEISYKNKYRRNYAEKHELMCNSCSSKRAGSSFVKYIKPYQRECPNCKQTITYSQANNMVRAIRKKSVCNKCAIRNTDEVIEKIRQSCTGKKYPNRKSNTKVGKVLSFKRNCPQCKKEMGYVTEFSFTRAIKQNAVCNSCSSKIYKKSWKYVIKDEHVKKMAAKKAGYDTYDAYMADLDNRKQYYREVRKITRQQDIRILENYDKLRGLCGVDGAYQLDHIIPVSVGYEQNIAPATIGHISNLQIIPWKDNLLKSNR